MWRPTAHLSRGVAAALLGATAHATDELTATIEMGRAAGAVEEVYLAHAQLALLAAGRGAWSDARSQAQAAAVLVERRRAGRLLDERDHARGDCARGGPRGDDTRTRGAALARAHRLRPLLDEGIPWLTIGVGLELARAHLALGEVNAARTALDETERVLELRPHMGSLVEDARELRARVAAGAGSSGAWAMSLTGAELRLLPYLATHLTFPEIASRLFISRNTAKTEAVAIYRKFGVSSRSEAIERAVELGLLEGSIYPPRADLIQDG